MVDTALTLNTTLFFSGALICFFGFIWLVGEMLDRWGVAALFLLPITAPTFAVVYSLEESLIPIGLIILGSLVLQATGTLSLY